MSDSWRNALAQPGIRALAMAWFLSLVSTFSLTVAALVYAYDHGGAALVAVYGLASTAPGAVFTPLLMGRAATSRGDRVLRRTTGVRAVLIALAAVTAVAEVASVLVVVLAAVASCLGATFRPTQAALLPWLARTPGELTAANVSATVAENSAALAGPVLAAVLLGWGDATATIAVAAVFMTLATLALRPLDVPQRRVRGTSDPQPGGLLRESLVGGRALLRVAPPAGLIVLSLAQTFVRGAVLVLVTVLALETLQLAESSVGWLNAGIGVGGLVGAVVASRAIRLTRLGRCFVAGVLLWGVGVAVLAGVPGPLAAFVVLGLVGVGNALEDASAFTLMPRLLGTRVVVSALGVFELVVLAGMGAGALAAPLLVDVMGVRNSLLVLGGGLCGLSLLYFIAFARVDRAVPATPPAAELLRGVPMLAPLPIVVIEDLADSLEPNRYRPGETVMAEGAPGDRYHLITEGQAQVVVRGVSRRSLGPGDGFGEIALLRDVPRTATVTAQTDLTTLSLARSAFLDAVSTSRISRHQADQLVDRRLAQDAGEEPRG